MTAKKVRTGVVTTNTNSYGANQWIADPRQQLFLAYYLDPKSPTFANALQSGLKAGFAQNYAENIMSDQPTWLMEKLEIKSPMLLKAERNLDEMMELPSQTQAMGAFGPIFEKTKEQDGFYKNGKPKFKKVKKPVYAFNANLLKIKNDASKFVAERIGRDRWGLKTPELEQPLTVNIFSHEQHLKIAQRVIGEGSANNKSGKRKSD